MKNYKKVIALLMTASMTLGLAACGGKEDDTQKNSGDSQNPGNNSENNTGGDSETESGPDAYTVLNDPKTGQPYDLGGMDIIIRDWWSKDPDPDKQLNGYEQAQKEYRDWIQETYKFTIKEQSISGWGDVFTDLESYVTTGGDDQNYVFTLRIAGELFSQMNAGLYYDLSSLDTIDMSGEKWDQTVKEFGTKDGKSYMMRKMSHEPRTGVYFNKRVLKENGIDPEEIYKLQREHKWTWDKFVEYLEMLTKDTDADGVIDQYGFLEANSLNEIAIASNMGNLVGRDESGKFTYELESENTLEAMNWAVDIRERFNKPNPDTETPDQTWDYFWNEFKSGGAAFMVQQAYAAGQDLSDMEDEFGFVAFPMGPKATTYVDLMQDNIHVIPACYDEDKARKIAFAYSLYYNPVPEYEDYSDYYASFVNNFCDMEAPEETIGYMGENTVMMMHGFVPGIKVGDDFFWAINKENTPAAQAESIRDTWKAYIDAANSGS